MGFIDLKIQYRRINADIETRIQRVLDQCKYFLAPEVPELEEKLAT